MMKMCMWRNYYEKNVSKEMADNSTNMKKTSNYISPETISQKYTTNGNPGPCMGQGQTVAVLKRLMGLCIGQDII